MTKGQRIHLMSELWPPAARALGCALDDRERRLEEISKALKRPVESAIQIGGNDEFDEVKKHLLKLAQPDNLNAQVEMENMPRTRLLMGIRERRDAYGWPRFQTLITERFGTADWESLPDWQLVQLRNTLAARLSKSKKQQLVPF